MRRLFRQVLVSLDGIGKRLLEGLPHPVVLEHTSTRTLASGVVALCYVPGPSSDR
jgi:hypothetical protein